MLEKIYDAARRKRALPRLGIFGLTLLCATMVKSAEPTDDAGVRFFGGALFVGAARPIVSNFEQTLTDCGNKLAGCLSRLGISTKLSNVPASRVRRPMRVSAPH